MLALERLLVAVPLAELGYSAFWQKLCQIREFGWLVYAGRVLTLSGSYIHDSHTKLVRRAFEKDVPAWDRLLFLEHDHEFPPDVFQRHAAYTQPIMAGHYPQRALAEPLPVIYMWDERRLNAVRPQPIEMKRMLDERGIYEVDIVPMGCTSIRRDVFENWPEAEPMFMSPANPATGTTMSDDVWFCRKAQDQGYPIYVDTRQKVGHMVLHTIDDSYFVAWWNKQQQQKNGGAK